MGRGKQQSRKSRKKAQQAQQRSSPTEAQAGPSNVPKIVEPVPEIAEPSTPPRKEPVDTPRRRLPVTQTPSPHNTGDIQKYDEDAVKILSLPKIRNKLPKEVSQRLRDVAGSSHGKRSISQLSNLEINTTPPPAKKQMLENDRTVAELLIDSRLQAKKTHLASAEGIVTILNEEWHAGSLNFTQNEFQSEIEKLERLITALKGDIAVILTSRHELSGRLVDEKILRQDEENTNWAYLDLLISRYKTPEGARLSLFASRDDDAQQRFQRGVMNAYDADDETRRWCVISGQWHRPKHVNAAHIVGYNVGEPSARHLFGPSSDKDGHLTSVKNGLPMHDDYEELFDDARLVIVPDEQGRLKVNCLYAADPKESSIMLPSGAELDGRLLQFRNDSQPSLRYLYFSFCMNILRRQRHDVRGWWRDYLDNGPGKVWATPGSYLRTSTLRKLAHQVGHLTEEEAEVFAGGGTIELADEDEEKDSTHSLLVASFSQKFSHPCFS